MKKFDTNNDVNLSAIADKIHTIRTWTTKPSNNNI